jgi:hypothetical protein
MLNTTFNNISVISWRSILLVEETGVPGENQSRDTDKLYHIMTIVMFKKTDIAYNCNPALIIYSIV